ncbi:20543_t:CDS:2 [Cetraspora pellucida]|uniref:20543_t:CDS:1 n=1 Tax=Cetraspora pellucida TaxID=1433469 RepID=A0A9N9FXL4_9GLOM|nr:20543_t:CDS:2 [Cetraspora pellucida]
MGRWLVDSNHKVAGSSHTWILQKTCFTINKDTSVEIPVENQDTTGEIPITSINKFGNFHRKFHSDIVKLPKDEVTRINYYMLR